jgi:hypothetical protein
MVCVKQKSTEHIVNLKRKEDGDGKTGWANRQSLAEGLGYAFDKTHLSIISYTDSLFIGLVI